MSIMLFVANGFLLVFAATNVERIDCDGDSFPVEVQLRELLLDAGRVGDDGRGGGLVRRGLLRELPRLRGSAGKYSHIGINVTFLIDDLFIMIINEDVVLLV